MIKKFLLWTLYAAFVALLVYGGLNRTSFLKDESSNGHNDRTVDSESVPAQDMADVKGQDGRWQSETTEHPGEYSAEHSAEAEHHDWLTLEGIVTDYSRRGLLITLMNGEELEFVGRTWRFAQSQGFNPGVGEKITLMGFYENGEYKVAQVTTADGTTIFLRSESGEPLWVSAGIDD